VVEEVKSHYGRYTESRVGVDILDEDVLNLFLRIFESFVHCRGCASYLVP
jgi:hypothetical protein